MTPRRARPSARMPPTRAAGAPASAGSTMDPTVVADRLHSAAIHLLRSLRREDDRSGLSAPRLSALSVLVFAGPLTLGELAAAEQVTAPTMSRLVSWLEGEGYVTREAGAEDARVVIVQATSKGVRTLEKGRRRRVAQVRALLGDFGDADWRSVRAAVEVIERALAGAGDR